LLPIREAYEWKPLCIVTCCIRCCTLLPIREAYEWKPFGCVSNRPLVTLRLASNSWSVWMETPVVSCKQTTQSSVLASNSWSVWMETLYTRQRYLLRGTCFQFVKRMNGNTISSFISDWYSRDSCFQFVKRMNGNRKRNRQFYSLWTNESCFQFVKRMNGNTRAASHP